MTYNSWLIYVLQRESLWIAIHRTAEDDLPTTHVVLRSQTMAQQITMAQEQEKNQNSNNKNFKGHRGHGHNQFDQNEIK